MENIEKLVDEIWPLLSKGILLFNGEIVNILPCEAYYEYYDDTIRQMEAQSEVPHVQLDIIPLLQELQSGSTHEAALGSLKSRTPSLSDETSGNLLNLAARLLSMLPIGTFKERVSHCGHLDWTSGSLGDFVNNHLEVPPKLNCDNVRLPRSFDAWSVAVVAGIEIEFTNNLADHLLLFDDEKRLKIFPHASFLELQRNIIFSDRFATETLKTLALLFPRAQFSRTSRQSWQNSSKRRWFKKLTQKHEGKLDPQLIRCGTLSSDKRQIRGFEFWRDRLVILKEAFDETSPRTLTQWWYDERDGVRWSTFWVAMLVLIITTFLGIIQCVEGALQVYKSFN